MQRSLKVPVGGPDCCAHNVGWYMLCACEIKIQMEIHNPHLGG